MRLPAERERGGGTKTALLVIGYGNELRCDDGVGPKTAAAVANWNLPGVRSLVCHQLTPELAAEIAGAECVVFVDATVDSTSSVRLRELYPAESEQIMAHAADPRLLLRMANELFGHLPTAFLLTIPAENMEFGNQLSARALEGLYTALQRIRGLLGTLAAQRELAHS